MLVDLEWKVLRHIATGEDAAGLGWGGGMGQALEVLRGHRLIEKADHGFQVSDTGRLVLAHYAKVEQLANWAAEEGDPDVLALAQAVLDGESATAAGKQLWIDALAIHAIWAKRYAPAPEASLSPLSSPEDDYDGVQREAKRGPGHGQDAYVNTASVQVSIASEVTGATVTFRDHDPTRPAAGEPLVLRRDSSSEARVASWVIVCADARVRHYPYRNRGDAVVDARLADRRGCRFYEEPNDLELGLGACPGGSHRVMDELVARLLLSSDRKGDGAA